MMEGHLAHGERGFHVVGTSADHVQNVHHRALPSTVSTQRATRLARRMLYTRHIHSAVSRMPSSRLYVSW